METATGIAGNRKPSADVLVEGYGTVYLLRPVTIQGTEWLNDNVDPDCPRLGEAWAIEHGYVGQIVEGMLESGLEVRG